ncbi:MAG: hypothetical protein QM703_22785 [Gemmatales bacterium]
MSRKKIQLVEGLGGIQMREDVARFLEQVDKNLGSSEKLVHRTKALSDPKPQIVVGETADIAWCSVEVPDADGDVVLISGIDKTQFDLRPVALWNHDPDKLPVGRWAWTRLEKHPIGAMGLLGKLIYDGDEFSQTLYQKSETGSVLGRSISFYTSPAWIRPATEEEKANPLWQGVGDVIEKCFLTEITVCSLQCNPLALVTRDNIEASPVALPLVEDKKLEPTAWIKPEASLIPEKKVITIKKRLTEKDYNRIYMDELKRIDVAGIVRREIQKLR